MITNPNTSGIFETDFSTIAEEVHQAGGLVYMDGANMNAIAGIVDLSSLVWMRSNNLHKTWTIPHGGGGPGDAIVAVSEPLVPFFQVQTARMDGHFDPTFPKVPSVLFIETGVILAIKYGLTPICYGLGKKVCPECLPLLFCREVSL